MRISTILFTFFISLSVFAQEINKENLSKQKSTYWDFNKSQIQSKGKYFRDELGETREKHGKWTYYDRLGEIEEVRNYYRDMLSGSVILFYPNGKKRQEGYFKYGRQDSLYLEWYETGRLKIQGKYKLDEAINTWHYYYRDGLLKSVEETTGTDNYLWEFYLSDSLHTQTIVSGTGMLTTHYITGQVKELYNYKDGLKDGDFEEFSVYGYKTLKGSFKDGAKDGKWEYAYYTGDKEKISHYENSLLEGDYTYYYDNGQVNVEGKYKSGKKDGEWIWYTNTGKKDMAGSFKNDLQHGDWSYWHPTGEVSYQAHYTDNLKTGEWSYFYKNGKKFKVGEFDNDLKNGVWRTWYEDETLLMEGGYVNGKEEGEWNNYWKTGDLKNTTYFKTGELNGEWKSFYPNGKVKLKGKYIDNMKAGEWDEFFKNERVKDVMTYKLFKKKSKVDYGFMKNRVVIESKLHGYSVSYSSKDFKMTETGNYKRGLKDGEWIAYYPGGKAPAVISQYKKGKLHGTMQQFTRRGKIISEVDYKEGLKHGKFKVYDKKGDVINERSFEYGMQIVQRKSNSPGSFSPGK